MLGATHALLAGLARRPARVALAGAGEFGRTLIAQCLRAPGIDVVAAADIDPARARAAFLDAGVAPEAVATCASAAQAQRALEGGKRAVLADGDALAALAVDLLVEATGHPDAAARHARLALDAGLHVAMVSKEADVVVGTWLARLAVARGRVYTPVDGDQPSLLIRLVGAMRVLGLPIVAAGKSSEYDFVFDPAARTVEAWGRRVPIDDPGLFDGRRAGSATEVAQARADALPGLPRRTVPDHCELTLVANATELDPDEPDLRAPITRTIELPHWFAEARVGGLFARRGALDVFNCLRRPDEASFAGGVFVVVEAPDAATARLLAGKGLPVAGRRVLVHNPVHLLGIEARATIAEAVSAGRSSYLALPRQRYDLVARAERPLRPGAVLALGARHAIDGVEPWIVPAADARARGILPYYLAAEGRVARDVPAGALLGRDDVLAAAPTLASIRATMDAEDVRAPATTTA